MWREDLGGHCVKFLLSKQAHADLLVFSDGRSRACRRALEQATAEARNQSEFWTTFKATPRLGRRVAWSSDNKEVSIVSFPVPRVQIPVKPRASAEGAAAGDTTTHDSTYSGVAPMPWTAMPLVSEADKANILGFQPAKPRVQLFDTALGQPLFWSERKDLGYWVDLLKDLNAAMVVDCTPGSGTAARAALQLEISYVGIARNSLHANVLCNVVDRHALKLMRAQGGPLYHQDLAECIVNHFKAILKHLDHMEGAEDTAPDGDLNPEETVS